jgi:uncharacterized membrane protein
LKEKIKRSFVKTITWRLTGSSSTFLISFFLTGSFTIASSIAVIQVISNTVLYYIHERLWNKVQWGTDK